MQATGHRDTGQHRRQQPSPDEYGAAYGTQRSDQAVTEHPVTVGEIGIGVGRSSTGGFETGASAPSSTTEPRWLRRLRSNRLETCELAQSEAGVLLLVAGAGLLSVLVAVPPEELESEPEDEPSEDEDAGDEEAAAARLSVR